MIILLLITFIDMVGFGIIFPLLPTIKIKYQISDISLAYVASSFALFNFIGSLFFGYISDKIGRKFVLYFPGILLGISYIATGFADNYIELIILRSISGFLAGTFVVSFAATADISSEENKFKNMALVGAAFGTGFILGPFMGGYFAGNSNEIHLVNLQLPFIIAGLISIFASLVAILFFKETLEKKDRDSSTGMDVIKHIKDLFKNKTFILMSVISIIISLIFAGLEVYLGLILKDRLLFTPQYLGYYWALFAICMTVFQVFLVRFFKPKKALIFGFSLLSVALLMILMIYDLYILGVMTLIMTIAISVIFPSLNTNLSSVGAKNQQGLIFGLNNALGGIGRIIGPAFLGILYYIDPNLTWIISSIIALSTAIIVWKFFKVS
jgi:MFS family permease